MPDKKIAEIKTAETAVAQVEEKNTEKKAPAAAKRKTAAKKTASEKKTAAVKKTASEKKTAAKRAASAVDSKVVIQALGSEVNTADLVAKATKASGVKTVKKVDVYVKPEVNKVYYVVNGDTFGDFDLF